VSLLGVRFVTARRHRPERRRPLPTLFLRLRSLSCPPSFARRRRPSAGTYGVWSDALWQSALQAGLECPAHEPPQVGFDGARYGDDFAGYHVRRGPVSLHHESHNGWDASRRFLRLKELAAWCASLVNQARPRGAAPVKATEIPLKIDDDGFGGAIGDLLAAAGYHVVRVGAACTAAESDKYPNKRSELWFGTAERARRSRLCLGNLPRQVLARLRQQAMAPVWTPDAQGRRVVERKEKTKEKLGRSPDDMDALNLA
jgi:hypothetical protein